MTPVNDFWQSFFDRTETITIQRWISESNVDGEVSESYSADESIFAIVLPMSGNVIRQHEHGEYNSEDKIVFFENSIAVKDKILHKGIWYEIRSVSDWKDHGNIFQTLAKKII